MPRKSPTRLVSSLGPVTKMIELLVRYYRGCPIDVMATYWAEALQGLAEKVIEINMNSGETQ